MKHDVLKQFITLRESLASEKSRIEARLHQLNSILNGNGAHTAVSSGKKGGMSAAGRARIAAAQKARWAKFHAAKKGSGAAAPVKQKRKMSAAGRARIIAAQKARWARVRAKKG